MQYGRCSARVKKASKHILIDRTYIRGKSLILLDENGSEASMPLQDALVLLSWLQEHKDEIEAALQEPDEEETFAVD